MYLVTALAAINLFIHSSFWNSISKNRWPCAIIALLTTFQWSLSMTLSKGSFSGMSSQPILSSLVDILFQEKTLRYCRVLWIMGFIIHNLERFLKAAINGSFIVMDLLMARILIWAPLFSIISWYYYMSSARVFFDGVYQKIFQRQWPFTDRNLQRMTAFDEEAWQRPKRYRWPQDKIYLIY